MERKYWHCATRCVGLSTLFWIPRRPASARDRDRRRVVAVRDLCHLDTPVFLPATKRLAALHCWDFSETVVSLAVVRVESQRICHGDAAGRRRGSGPALRLSAPECALDTASWPGYLPYAGDLAEPAWKNKSTFFCLPNCFWLFLLRGFALLTSFRLTLPFA